MSLTKDVRIRWKLISTEYDRLNEPQLKSPNEKLGVIAKAADEESGKAKVGCCGTWRSHSSVTHERTCLERNGGVRAVQGNARC